MIRCTIELVPFGVESAKRKIGIVEIANDGSGSELLGNYKVILRKTPPWKGALKHQWKAALVKATRNDNEVIAGKFEGFDRIERGPYDLLYRALKACGLNRRNE